MFTWYGKCQRPQHCRCPEACGVSYRMRVNGTHNTVGKGQCLQHCLGPIVPGKVAGYCLAGAQGMVPVLWF